MSVCVTDGLSVVETFDEAIIGEVPLGWARHSSTADQFEVTGERSVSGLHSLKSSGDSGTHARAWVSGIDHDNVEVSATVLVERLNRVGVLARGTSLDQDNATFWAATVERGLTVSLWKVVDGNATQVAAVSSSQWTSGVPVRLTLRANADNLRIEAYRTDTGRYLDRNGLWVSESGTFAVNLTDAAISGCGSVGVVRFAMYSETVYLDDFSAEAVVAESTPPSVSLLSPAAGADLSGTVEVEVSASGASGVANVEFLLDGKSRHIDGAGPYTWLLDTTIVPNGLHQITVRATDTAGNIAEDSISVTVANETDIALPEIPRHFSHIRTAAWVSDWVPLDPFKENLLATSVDLVKSGEAHLSAIDAISPSTPQLLYSTETTQLLKVVSLIDYLNFADDNRFDREDAFYHVSTRLPYSGTSPSSVPVDKFDRVLDAAGADATSDAYSQATGQDIEFGRNPGESIHVGFADPFREIRVVLRSAAANGYGVAIEYPSAVDSAHRPTAWSALPLITDGTAGLTVDGRILFDPPSDWTTASVDGHRMYWLRFRTTAAGTAPVAATIKGRDYTGAAGGNSGVIPAFDFRADLNADGYLNDVEYAGREPGHEARFVYESRLPHSNYGTGRWWTRPGDAGFRAWAVQFHRDELPAAADGWFLDNGSGNPPRGDLVREPTGAYSEELGMLMNQVWNAIEPKWVLPNTAGGSAWTDAVVSNSPSYFEEFSIRALDHSAGQFRAVADQVGHRGALHSPPPIAVIDSHPTHGVLGSDGYWDERLQIATLAYYYLIADSDTYLSLFVGWEPSGFDWRNHWSDAIPHDVGQPVSSMTEYATGLDPADGSSTYTVFGREFDHALVLYRPASWAGADRTDASAVTLPLDGRYRELRADGTLGPVVTEVTLKNNQGAILQRVVEAIASEDFDGTPVGEIPAGWATFSNTGDNFQVGASHPSSQPHSFVTSGASNTAARAWVADRDAENVEVAATVFVDRLNPVGVLARGTALETAAPSYWAATIERGLRVSLWKVVDGTATLVEDVQSTAWTSQVPVRLMLVGDGDRIQVQAYRTDTGQYLDSLGRWDGSEAFAISLTDASLPGAGKVGVVRLARYADSIALDDFSAAEIVSSPADDVDDTDGDEFPAGWARYSNTGHEFQVDPASPSLSFVTSGASDTEARAWIDDRDAENVEVAATVVVNRLSPVGVLARGTELETAAPTYWAATIERGLRVSLFKVTCGTATLVKDVQSTAWTSDVPVRLALVTDGDSIQVQAYRTDTEQYLDAFGDWIASEAFAISLIDASIPGPGKAGLVRLPRYADTVAVDDFSTKWLT